MNTLRKILAWPFALIGFPVAYGGCALLDLACWIQGGQE